jgi:hypothetical protein
VLFKLLNIKASAPHVMHLQQLLPLNQPTISNTVNFLTCLNNNAWIAQQIQVNPFNAMEGGHQIASDTIKTVQMLCKNNIIHTKVLTKLVIKKLFKKINMNQLTSIAT